MVYTDAKAVRLLTHLTTSDISNTDVFSIIAEAIVELNRLINVKVIRERVEYIDETRPNEVNGSNTTYYVKNWRGKYLADMDNDGDVDTSDPITDIIVYLVDSNGTETTATVSTLDVDNCQFVLSSAPGSDKKVYVTYEWCYRNPNTPDPLIKLACTNLATAYCYAKINWGRPPQERWGNISIYRHMDAFRNYYDRAIKLVNQINESHIGMAESEEI